MKVTSYTLDFSGESRPNVRLVLRKGYNARNQKAAAASLKVFGQRVLNQVQENIRSNMNGSWTPVQWGLKAGSPALLGTEEQWSVQLRSMRQVVIAPRTEEFKKRWRGHILGMTIRAKTKRFMHFFLDDGSEWFLKKVKLPTRDPRPTETQIKDLGQTGIVQRS